MSNILDLKSIKDGLNDYYEQGGGKTFYCGFNVLSNHYNIKEGGVTDWSGYPGSGKTELLLQVLVNCTKWYGHKHLIYMPDAGSNEEVVAKLIHKYTGKQFEEFFYNKKGEKVEIKNRITQEEMFRVLPEIIDSFKIFIPEVKEGNKTRSKAVTPVEYWNFAAENKKELGIFSGVIDSWNYMKHDVENQRHDQWLEEVLSYRNELAERNDLHLHTIIHPKAARKDKNGVILMPDMNDLKGGSEWGNNGKTIILVHRKFESNVTEVLVHKAKPRIVGIQGTAALYFDLDYGGFYENINGKREYSHKEPIEVLTKKAVQPVEVNVDERTESNNNLDDLPF